MHAGALPTVSQPCLGRAINSKLISLNHEDYWSNAIPGTQLESVRDQKWKINVAIKIVNNLPSEEKLGLELIHYT